MSEPIYREADEDEAAAYFDSCLRNPFNVKEILGVPVEPDYEAATAKLIEQGPSDFTDENVARNIIHAAFKGAEIGGDG